MVNSKVIKMELVEVIDLNGQETEICVLDTIPIVQTVEMNDNQFIEHIKNILELFRKQLRDVFDYHAEPEIVVDLTRFNNSEYQYNVKIANIGKYFATITIDDCIMTTDVSTCSNIVRNFLSHGTEEKGVDQ